MAFISATCPDSSFFLEYKDENGLLRKSCMAASHRVVGETGLSDSGPSSSNHHVPYATVLHGINAPSTSFLYDSVSLKFHTSIFKTNSHMVFFHFPEFHSFSKSLALFSSVFIFHFFSYDKILFLKSNLYMAFFRFEEFHSFLTWVYSLLVLDR